MPKATSYTHEVNVLTNSSYLIGYCSVRENPVWVAYRLFEVEPPNEYDRPGYFRIDKRTEAEVSHDDYTNSGYDRGHMAPAYGIFACYGQKALEETFLMSNVVPQQPGLNRGTWKSLEERLITDYAAELDEIWIIAGPIFDAIAEDLDSGVDIPDGYFKIVLDRKWNGLRVLAFLFPEGIRNGRRLGDYLVSVDAIEEKTGVDFLAGLPDRREARIEATQAGSLW